MQLALSTKMVIINPPFMLFVIVKLLLFSSQISSETDTITQFQPLVDGTTLVNADGTFELGFFSPGSSKNRYVGIWFKNVTVRTVVWVANRDNPISDKSGMLTISKEGNLVLLSKNNATPPYWSTNGTTKISGEVIAQLLGSGNFVLKDEKDSDHGGYLWQSFDYPTDTILPGMKLGWNLTSGLNRRIIAWKNWDDPSSGHLTYGFIRRIDNPEMEIWINGSSNMIYRSGPWIGIRYSGTPKSTHRLLFNVDFVTNNKDEYYFAYKPKDPSLISRIVINETVNAVQRFTWSSSTEEGNKSILRWNWKLVLNLPRDGCDYYGHCGPFGNCAIMGKSPVCQCLSGFKPKSPQNWSQGCVRSESWGCREKNKDGFIRFKNIKVPDTRKSWIDRSVTLEECKAKCWENCSCTAYANSDITDDGSGCILWFGDLLDLRQLPDSGQDLYVRSSLASQTANRDDAWKTVVVVTSTAVSSIVAMLLIFTFIYLRRKTKSRGIKTKVKRNESNKEDLELPLFDFATVSFATDDFSNDKKLGDGGFGPVYMAWKLWKECNPMEFIDTCLKGSYIPSEALRCIHIGLLCVQHYPDDRPTMASVLVMLTSDSTLLQPKEPIFLVKKASVGEESTSGQKIHCSTNEISFSMVVPR